MYSPPICKQKVVMAETWTIPCVEHIPDAEELEQLFQDLGNNKIPQLQWKNPGRRALSPVPRPFEATTPAAPTQAAELSTNDSYDFFDDSPMTEVRVRKPVTPKSAKKKTLQANFDSVLDSLSAVKKHGRLANNPKDGNSANSNPQST